MERPVANDSQALTVQFSFTLMQVMDVQWYDHYLQWNQSEYPGVKNLRFTADQVWTPDILLYNSAHDKFDATFKTNVLVNSSGFCEYLPPGIFISTCNVDVRWFPFDIQRCELKFGSWTFDGWLLDLQMKEADVSGYMPNGEWDLLEVPGGRHEVFYDCCAEPYPDVTFVVTLRRRTLFYALNLLIPCVLLSSMTLLVFLAPCQLGGEDQPGHHGAAFSDCLHADGCRDYARHFRFCTPYRSVLCQHHGDCWDVSRSHSHRPSVPSSQPQQWAHATL
ncbi:Neuronal acetylcholine receptor subunit alpha-7, partial [Larimichthys crocea]